KAHLIVALTGGAVGDGVGTLFSGDIDLRLGNQRPGNRGAQQIGSFVDGIGAQHGKDVLLDEFFPQVADDGFARTGFNRFTANRLQILALTEVGTESDNLTAVLFHEPTQNNRSVQS